ncbi:MAG TPA: hypothetical protein VHP33_28925 [Polyangiaceae bacterium]|nr:hypothetical protein [Polyangiaceae bacterium]
MATRVARSWNESVPWLVSLAAYVFASAVLALRAYRSTGEFAFPLDDAYIHMAVARSLAEHGVWGVTPDAFSASTSSLLWPALLAAGFVLTGPTVLWPLALNLFAGAGVLLLTERWLRETALPSRARLPVLLLLSSVLGSAALLGMEHTPHALAALLLLRCASSMLSSRAAAPLGLGISAAFATGLRYESLLFVGILTLCLVAQRKPRAALAVTLGGLLPAAAFGAWSVAQGWELLPNPVTQKRAAFGWESSSLRFALNVSTSPALLAATLVLLGLAWHQWRASAPRRASALLALLVAASTAGHLCFAATDALARYETYLLVLAVVSLALLLQPVFGGTDGRWGYTHAAAGGGLAAVALLSAVRAYGVWSSLPTASRNIYDQQLQTARFVRALPSDVRVAVNDIGAVSLRGEHRIFDLWALASLPPSRYRTELARSGSIRNLARTQGARIAVAYAHTFLPNQHDDAPPWRDLGQLTIANNVTCADATVHFYAADDRSAVAARAALERLLPTLPARTQWREAQLSPKPTSPE